MCFVDYVIQNIPVISTTTNAFCSNVQKCIVTSKGKCVERPKLNAPNVIKAVAVTKGSDFLHQLVRNSFVSEVQYFFS